MLNFPQTIFSAKDFDSIVNDFFIPSVKTEESVYPPYNIIKDVNNNSFRIEMAVAGIEKNNINLEIERNILTISHKKDKESLQDPQNTIQYLHRGISQRSFVQRFLLGEHVKIRNADLLNGILVINLDIVISEDKKSKKISIGEIVHGNKELLVE